VKLKKPVVAVDPLTTPVEAFKFRPGGRDPEARLNVSGPVPRTVCTGAL